MKMFLSRMAGLFSVGFILIALSGNTSARNMPVPVPDQSVADAQPDGVSRGTTGDMTSDLWCDVAGCHYDLQLYCLSNGVIVMGSCSLKNTLCTNGLRNSLRLADGWDLCFQATYALPRYQQQMVIVHNQQTAAKNDLALSDAQHGSLNFPPADVPSGEALEAGGGELEKLDNQETEESWLEDNLIEGAKAGSGQTV